MKKTLLLCFIHGFKGGDNTFERFPQDLRAIVSHALPKVSVRVIVYPKFDTRGDLHECVARFKEWLQNKVIDLETANRTPSPTINPSVHTILVGHSMGGIVAAETLIAITQDQPISSSGMLDDSSSFMFPYVQGILAFDTPYLGISPGVVAHGAEGHWNTASSAYNTYTNLAGAFGYGAKAAQPPPEAIEASRMLPSPSKANSTTDAAAAPAWQRWGKMAMYAGAIGAVAAGGAAAYMRREQLSEGWTWVGSHLEFVGCLARGEEMQKRLAKVVKIKEQHQFGFANLYTCLGHAVQGTSKWSTGALGEQRTFCSLPKQSSSVKQYFLESKNDAATSETGAHTAMFTPRENPGYYSMSEVAKGLIVEWMTNEWYEEAEVDDQMRQEKEKEQDEDVEMVEKPDEAEAAGFHTDFEETQEQVGA
ncbi:hypothetical protein K402DRAFT_342064 [Aulographum hederae CBS 113979]|uniref:DUF676 domain-containing protein n=1 Tax=Aulographum hederae CBS 113979 TaxID=1176131 RepID=A0A6G1GL63_9PEZI|nr:hypothetical protein K402DRAFT_342064 [Aulographum hederae CBS 113979]